MKKTFLFMFVIVIFFSLIQPSQAGDMKFQVQLSYVSGLDDVYDLYINNLEAEGYIISSKFNIPIGICFHPYFEFDFGLRLGGGVGPIAMIIVSGADASYFDLPVNVHVGYTLIPPSSVSPYVKTGFVYHVNSGEYLESSSPGLFFAGGIDFLRTKRISFGFEVAMDLSEAKFQDKTSFGWDLWGEYYDEYEEKNIMIGGLSVGLFVKF